MMKKLRLIPVILGMIALTITSCEDENKESCDRFPENVGSCLAEDITACCDDTQSCYYTYNGEDYTESELIAACSTSSTISAEIQLQLDSFTAQLIEEARSAAICK